MTAYDAHDGDIYIGTILPEVNRWAPGKAPTYRVSDWLSRFAADGFDGLELWENHALLASPEERAALEASPLPVAVYSAYVSFDEAGAAGREEAARMAARLGARGVKFNLGPDLSGRDMEVRRARAWREMFAPGVRLLCECHPGTYMEDPERAAETFSLLGQGFQVIIHPFLETPESLERWFAHLRPLITHAHVQVRDAAHRPVRLDRRPDEARATLRRLRDLGFAGSFTLEFTEGTGAPGENAGDLYRAALTDLAFLRENGVRPTEHP